MNAPPSNPVVAGNGVDSALLEHAAGPDRMQTNGHRRDIGHEDIDLLACWLILRKRQRLILGCWVGAMLLALSVSLLWPKTYESTATVLPQTDTKDSSTLTTLLTTSGLGAAAQNMGMTLPGMPTTPTDVFVAILKSRLMADAVIQQFDLMTRYGADTMVEARKKLARKTKLTITKEKVIQVKIKAREAQLAADMANFHVAHLDRLNRVVTVSKAGQNRQFIERRVADTRASLAKAEEALKDFQTTNKTVAVEAQSKAMIEAGAQLQAQISAQEVQLQVLSNHLLPDNPELLRVQSGLTELKRQLAMLETGKDGKGMLPGDRLHPAMITVPSLALEYGRLLRELKVQETLYSLLTAQYEQARLAEARDTPTVQVLDPAVPADEPTWPKLGLNVVIGSLLGLSLGVLIALVQEQFRRAGRGLAARSVS